MPDLISNRKFGIELETSRCPENVVDLRTLTSWRDVADGSITGREFVSPALFGNAGIDSVRRTADWLVRNGARVDRACGFHLHIDMNGTSAEQRKAIALAYAYTEEFWFSCADDTRQLNTYCRKGETCGWTARSIIDDIDAPRPSIRYCWLNWCSYEKHGTMEVRLYQGTIDAEEIINWIKAHLTFVEKVKDMTIGQIKRKFGGKSINDQKRNMRDIWLDDEVSNYYMPPPVPVAVAPPQVPRPTVDITEVSPGVTIADVRRWFNARAESEAQLAAEAATRQRAARERALMAARARDMAERDASAYDILARM